jgi:predicted DNA-binding protein (MmcQ/YjbR family)
MPDLEWIRKLCLSLPEATEDMPWADDLCFKVRGKIFTGTGLSDGRYPRVTLKCSPERFHELLEIEGIAPAPYVGRYKWVMLVDSNVLPARELEELIRQSYEMVAAKAPKRKASGRKKRKHNVK